MFRVAIALCAVLALVTSGSGAPIPKARPAWDRFFPTEVGTKWVYDTVFDEVSEEVVESERSGGELRWTVRRVSSLSTSEWSYVASRDGVFERPAHGEEGERRLLRFPLIEGEPWDFEPFTRSEKSGRPTVRATSGKWAEVQTPVGAYTAVAVSTAATTRWYAPGVGLVMVENEGGRKQLLKSFNHSKSDTK